MHFFHPVSRNPWEVIILGPEESGVGSKMVRLLGPKLLLPMGCLQLGDKICVHLPSVGEQTANQLSNFTQPMGSNYFGPSTSLI